MAKVHWLGAGLSSVPGIRRLATVGNVLILWNRTLSKAEQAVQGLDAKVPARRLDWQKLAESVSPGDVVVSMLPATMHLQVADICLDRRSHFVSSSYVSPDMAKLDATVKQRKLCFVNEVGLDPGLDHLMAHVLVHNYTSSRQFETNNELRFRSYCGGFPRIPNDFKYKFSWSPLGVLRALKSPAQWIADSSVQNTDKPWKSVKSQRIQLPDGIEAFEAYPNRDSLPFMDEYGFKKNWKINEFIRGTLRLNGWSDAWSEIFELVEHATGEAGQQALETRSQLLWNDYRYDDGEPDRVVLSVELEASSANGVVWHQAYCLDETGDARGSAMSRLVSLTTSIAVESVLNGEIGVGVSAAPRKFETAEQWLNKMTQLGETFRQISIV